jgi:hypothetical protein
MNIKEEFSDFLTEKYNQDHVIQDAENYYFYKHIYVADDFVFGIFDKEELKYNYAASFNDPYDTQFNLKVDTKNITKRDFEFATKKKISTHQWNHVKRLIPMMIGKFESELKEEINKAINGLREQIPITCFNSNPLSILMWSHYAKNHTGFMLEYKIPKDWSSDLVVFPISYTDNYPVISMTISQLFEISRSSPDDPNEDLIKSMFLHKSTCWAYEKEYRAFDFDKSGKENPLLIRFDPNLLSSVVIGSRFKDTGKFDLLQQKLSAFNERNGLDVELYEASLYEDRYELKVDNHPRLSEENYKKFK